MDSPAIPHRLTVAGGMVVLLFDTARSSMTRSEQRMLGGSALGVVGGAAIGALTGEGSIAGAVIGSIAGAAASHVLNGLTNERRNYR
jgi:outer membrane lipoprotein SlyB